MSGANSVRRSRFLRALLLLTVVVGCDDDPTAPAVPLLNLKVASDSVLARQGAIKVTFGGAVDTLSALNPENFVVINECNGLRVPGALRLSGDTVIFSPSQALPFLTLLSIRVQNVLDGNGRPLTIPFTFRARTEAPEVTDVSWERLNTPTNEQINGVSFASRDTGFIVTVGGSVYRTTNSGLSFQAQFKDNSINAGRDIRAQSKDTLYVLGAQVGTGGLLLRSVNGGLTFQIVLSSPAFAMRGLSMLERPGSRPLFQLSLNENGAATSLFYDAQTGTQTKVVLPGVNQFAERGALSPNGTHAVIVGNRSNATFTVDVGFAFYSTNRGVSYNPITNLSPTVPALRGSGFRTATEAYLVGDTSTVLRLDAAAGTVTPLGALNGIPQTEFNAGTGLLIVYNFTRAAFAPEDPSVGWIVGTLVRRQPGLNDVRRGIILITRDGGNTFQRQAVIGADENGLGFEGIRDITVLSRSFATVSGENGFVAARKSHEQVVTQVCSFPTSD